MSKRAFHPGQPGFRFWWSDGVAILVCAVATWLIWAPLGRLALVLPVTLGHFFLFCNVFRIRPIAELIWTGFYVINMAYWLLFREFSWIGVLAVQSPATIALIVLELRSPHYRGILYRRLGPRLGGGDTPV